MEKHPVTLGKCAMLGAGVALALGVIFLLFLALVGGVWVFSPIVSVTIGGALGGVVYFQMAHVWFCSGRKKILATGISILFYVVLLWLCLVLTLSATGHWD